MKLRSRSILKRPEWSINRASYKCMGYVTKGYLKIYSRLASSAAEVAITTADNLDSVHPDLKRKL